MKKYLLLLCCALMFSCSNDEFQLRIIHLSPDLNTVEIDADGETIVDSLSFGQASPFTTITNNFISISAFDFLTGTPLFELTDFDFDSDRKSLILSNSASSLDRLELNDEVRNIASGKTSFRLFNTIASSFAYDVYISTPSIAITSVGSSGLFTNFDYNTVISYIDADADTYRVRMTQPGDTATMPHEFDQNIVLADGEQATFFLVEASGGGTPYQLIKVVEN